MYEVFDRKLQQYIEADLVNNNLRAWREEDNVKRFEKYEEPFAVLTLGKLEAGFVACFVPLAMSLVVFSIEWMITLVNLLIPLLVFRAYFEVKNIEAKNEAEAMIIKLSAAQVLFREKYFKKVIFEHELFQVK